MITIKTKPIFFSTRNDTRKINIAIAHKFRIKNNPVPMPNIIVDIPMLE